MFKLKLIMVRGEVIVCRFLTLLFPQLIWPYSRGPRIPVCSFPATWNIRSFPTRRTTALETSSTSNIKTNLAVISNLIRNARKSLAYFISTRNTAWVVLISPRFIRVHAHNEPAKIFSFPVDGRQIRVEPQLRRSRRHIFESRFERRTDRH